MYVHHLVHPAVMQCPSIILFLVHYVVVYVCKEYGTHTHIRTRAKAMHITVMAVPFQAKGGRGRGFLGDGGGGTTAAAAAAECASV